MHLCRRNSWINDASILHRIRTIWLDLSDWKKSLVRICCYMSVGTKRHVRACLCERGGDRVYTLYTACTVHTVWLHVTVFVFQPKTQRLARTAVIPSLINFFFSAPRMLYAAVRAWRHYVQRHVWNVRQRLLFTVWVSAGGGAHPHLQQERSVGTSCTHLRVWVTLFVCLLSVCLSICPSVCRSVRSFVCPLDCTQPVEVRASYDLLFNNNVFYLITQIHT